MAQYSEERHQGQGDDRSDFDLSDSGSQHGEQAHTKTEVEMESE